jgi:Gram-negative bacterial TonB protein C-terminal
MRASPIAIFALSLSVAGPCLAQQEPCGLRKMTETTTPIYPPIARAAHVEGVVVMLVNFKLNGEVEKIDVVSGPEMLKIAATKYVQGWRANEFTGPRTCPIAVKFHLLREKDMATPGVTRQDLQHVTLNSETPPILFSTPSYSTKGSN